MRYELKTPYSDGTTHVIFEPQDFIARLAVLVPKPRVNLTRFHGEFAPNSKYRMQVSDIHQRPLWVGSSYTHFQEVKFRFSPEYSYSVLISVILDTAGRYLSVKRDVHLRITNIFTEA